MTSKEELNEAKELMRKYKKARNEYYQRYRAKNPEKIREINIRYWMKQADKEEVKKDGGQEV